MIYHIRYISTYLPAARLVLGTISVPFGVREILRAPFHIWHGSAFGWFRIWQGGWITTVLLAPSTALHHPIHSPMMLHV